MHLRETFISSILMFILISCGASTKTDTDLSSSEQSSAEPLIVHGNYCGFGMKSPQQTDLLYKPKDLIDTICLQHDFCYDALGRRNCICDETLVKQANHMLKLGNLSRKQSLIAEAIVTIFSRNNCERVAKFNPLYRK